MRYLANTIPGIGRILADEIEDKLDTTADLLGMDGRNEVLGFDAKRPSWRELRTSEDVFVEVGGTGAGGTAARTTSALISRDALDTALSVYASEVNPLSSRASFRVIVRVLSEERFLRTELRDRLVERISELKPRWRIDDPAQLELWAMECSRGSFRLGLRLSTATMRHREGRPVERKAALRPTVAAAMLHLAEADGGEIVLDPCCGTGTIVHEAVSRGLRGIGSDVDVSAARPGGGAVFFAADVGDLPFRSDAVAATVSNLPFGESYELSVSLARALAQMRRVTRGSIVLLAPRTKQFTAAMSEAGVVIGSYDINLLGRAATIWRFSV